MDQNLKALAQIAIDAGSKIMEVYQKQFDIIQKSDQSPVTEADQLAEKVIIDGLREIDPNCNIIAEELASNDALDPLSDPKNDRFYLVDPLDGTKEFIARNGQFTVNIAVIEAQAPKIGIIFAPAINLLYVADVDQGYAFKFELNDNWDLDNPITSVDMTNLQKAEKPYKILASKSHINAETENYISDFEKENGKAEILNIGSSLKLCYVADGGADLYPRFGPTMEWDIGAGHAIILAAGGSLQKPDGTAFLYGKQNQDFKSDFFIASRL